MSKPWPGCCLYSLAFWSELTDFLLQWPCFPDLWFFLWMPSVFKTKISELRVVFWECSLREIMWLLFAAYLFVLSRIIVIFLILECSWRSCVLSLLNCAKYVLECSFPGYSTLISVTPSYIRLQWTFLLGVQLWFYSGTFSSWFRLSCMIWRGQEWFFFFLFKTPKTLFILLMILVLTQLVNGTFELLNSNDLYTDFSAYTYFAGDRSQSSDWVSLQQALQR